MQIQFDINYVFYSEKENDIYLYKVLRKSDHSNVGYLLDSKSRRWKKVTLHQFNSIGLRFIGNYRA